MLYDQPDTALQWLFLDLNSYFASVEQQETPAYRGKPVAVVPMMTDSTCAIAASYEAKLYGIRTGTKIYDAKKMCPGLICAPARHDLYVSYHNRIFAEVERHLPVTRICSIDEAACELWGEQRRPENAHALALQIKEGIRQKIGPFVRCSIGIAPNAFLAKVATEMEKPDGLVILEPETLKDRLFALSLRDLPGINIRMEQRLQRAGISTIEQLWNISPKHARKIWHSVEGERFWYKLHGYNIPERPTQKRMIGHSRILDPVLRRQAEARAITRQLLIKAVTRLRRYDLHAGKLYLGVRTVSRRKWGNYTDFPASQDTTCFLEALERLWQMMERATGTENLLKVSVSLFDLCEAAGITPDLFEMSSSSSDTPHRPMALLESVQMINRRYGANTITLGISPKTSTGYVGTKIAFTRIPDQEEFS